LIDVVKGFFFQICDKKLVNFLCHILEESKKLARLVEFSLGKQKKSQFIVKKDIGL
jgi:hypothetical protein